jgi:hypothetical protein
MMATATSLSHRWVDDAEKIAKTLSFVALSLYVLGLISVNGYLLVLGVSDFSLARVKFIYVGAWVIATFVLSYYFPLTLYRAMRATGEQQQLTKGLKLLNRIIAAMLLASGLYAATIPFWGAFENTDPASGSQGNRYFLALVLVLVGFLVGTIVAFAIRSNDAINARVFGRRIPSEVRSGDLAMAAAAVLVGALVYTFAFMAIAYPKIPPQLGGGRPQLMRLLIKDSSVSGVKELGLPMTHGNLTHPIYVLYEGSESYVIWLDKGQIVELSKDEVSGPQEQVTL